ncbi:hypothetical protein Tc00.1047053506803.14 [Trypanosoma cruzi]|uniref:Secreted protein n=1 Tax=Trypanosoma cruzi (strain CL Brener) TaxID=353153 RepID=Q4CSX3_TRYCC|nr:hypothetical protein Tc00.1047053506803.14 [Trypanosoma cruzi]EAN83376.1 hypothetical protein Tc00.1047053506803.14 [Trypanosoma cruzi]|eukprot:XP_805227.1 hypothetical protein [Trypanosoma cruzi strain CL Brener]
MFLIALLCVAVGDPCGGARGPKTKLSEGSPLCTMAAACGCQSVLSRDMPRRFYVCVASGTMCRRLCDCRMEGEERREVRERSGQESRWVSRRGGHCPPNAAPLLSGTLSHSLQHCIRRRQHAAWQRMPTPPRVRPEGNTPAVAFRGGHTVWRSGVRKTSSRSPHTTPGTGRGVFASWRTLRWSSSIPPGGRTPVFTFVLTHERFFFLFF